MHSRLCKSVVAMLLVFSIGGHWALLQSVAWVSMVVEYSKDAPISVAVSKTFDGEHPCGICKLVRKGKATEEKQEALKAKTKIDFWVPAPEVTLPRIQVEPLEFVSVPPNLLFRAHAPPLPPPRQA